MARVTSALLLLAGAVLLVTWLVSPASSAPQSAPLSRETSLDQILPVLADVNAQVERLRGRLTAAQLYPPPSRDPFNYLARAPRRPAGAIEPSEAVADLPPVLPVAPQLVAILTSNPSDGAVTRSAVLTDRDDDVQVVTVGESVGSFVVASIEEDVVVLTEKKSGQSVRLTLH